MASGKGDVFANEVLLHFLENADIATIGDASGVLQSASDGSVFIGLHTSAPDGAADTQATNECSYTGYAREAVARTAAKWTTASGATENTDEIEFTICSGGSSTATQFSIGAESAGATLLLYWGDLDSSLAISTGVTPTFAAGALDLTEA